MSDGNKVSAKGATSYEKGESTEFTNNRITDFCYGAVVGAVKNICCSQ